MPNKKKLGFIIEEIEEILSEEQDKNLLSLLVKETTVENVDEDGISIIKEPLRKK